MLNAKDISWGWFQGGFDLGVENENASTRCERWSPQTVPEASTRPADYTPHHAPFQYYRTTANPMHARPSSVTAIGSTFQTDGRTLDPANHHYDSHDFFDALRVGNFPAVSYLKAPAFQDGHAGSSNPIDEQSFIVEVVTAVQASNGWDSTAIILAYDDSDGWYDHQAPPIANPSNGIADALNGEHLCNQGAQQLGPAPLSPLQGQDGNPALGRCGYGTRLPLLVISPFAGKNYIDHTLTDQTSILKFIEDNWLDGERVQPGPNTSAPTCVRGRPGPRRSEPSYQPLRHISGGPSRAHSPGAAPSFAHAADAVSCIATGKIHGTGDDRRESATRAHAGDPYAQPLQLLCLCPASHRVRRQIRRARC